MQVLCHQVGGWGRAIKVEKKKTNTKVWGGKKRKWWGQWGKWEKNLFRSTSISKNSVANKNFEGVNPDQRDSSPLVAKRTIPNQRCTRGNQNEKLNRSKRGGENLVRLFQEKTLKCKGDAHKNHGNQKENGQMKFHRWSLKQIHISKKGE